MWSVWPETIRLYLGQQAALVARRGQPAAAVRSEGTGLEAVLYEVAALLPRRARLQVDLSASLCPAVAIRYPAGLQGPAERRLLAANICGNALGLAAGEVVCELDDDQPGVAAALPLATLSRLQDWAGQKRWSLASVRPLWAHAPALAQADREHLVIEEPDAVTLLRLSGDVSGFTLRTPQPDAAAWERMVDSMDLPHETVHRLCLVPQSSSEDLQQPALWCGFWRVM